MRVANRHLPTRKSALSLCSPSREFPSEPPFLRGGKRERGRVPRIVVSYHEDRGESNISVPRVIFDFDALFAPYLRWINVDGSAGNIRVISTMLYADSVIVLMVWRIFV